MSQTNQHQLLHEIDHLSSWHKFLFEGFYSQRECSTVHQHGTFRWYVTQDLLNISLEAAFKQSVSLVQNKKLAMSE